MGAKNWLDRMFRGEVVSDAAYSQPESETEQAEQLDGTYDRHGQSAYTARRDNVVEFPRASAGSTSFPRDAGAGFSRDPSDFTKELRGEGGGFGGGGYSGGGPGSFSAGGTDTGDAYVVFKLLKDFQMATQAADRMVESKIVILNLESCDDEVARRVLDFLGGVAYACSGMVKRIAGRVFMITPRGVNADGEFLDEAVRNGGAEIRYDD